MLVGLLLINNPRSFNSIQHTYRAYPINEIPSKTRAGAAIIHMIMNNLDSRVAQFPEELVTYGGNGQVGSFGFFTHSP